MLRLHKFLAQAGLASRRHAEGLIKDGRVRVNGQLITELGAKIDPEKDEVSVDGRAVRAAEARTTVVLQKPVGVVTTMSDPEGRRTVAALVAREPYRLVPIGRLDFHTEGVLLLTTDGELAHRLLHPSHKVPKIYVVRVGGHPTEARLEQLRRGIQLEDGMTEPALVSVLEVGVRSTWLEIIITEGRQRQVRRMCEAIEHRPLRVVRTSFATITGEGLKPGQYRYLPRAELTGLYGLVGLEPPPMSERARETLGAPLGDEERSKGALPDDASISSVGDEPPAWRKKALQDGPRARRPREGSAEAEGSDIERPRGPRREAREGAPRREEGGRAPRRDDGDRAARRDDARPPRRDDGDRAARRDDARPPRRDDGDRAPRRDEARAPRRDEGDRAPRRDEARAPRRDEGDRAPRRDDGDRAPRRDEGDRAPRRDQARAPRREQEDASAGVPSRHGPRYFKGSTPRTSGSRGAERPQRGWNRADAESTEARPDRRPRDEAARPDRRPRDEAARPDRRPRDEAARPDRRPRDESARPDRRPRDESARPDRRPYAGRSTPRPSARSGEGGPARGPRPAPRGRPGGRPSGRR